MADFLVSFEGHYIHSRTTIRFFDHSKEEAIKLAKRTADESGYRSIYILYMHSGKTVGYWEKKGSRWYKEW